MTDTRLAMKLPTNPRLRRTTLGIAIISVIVVAGIIALPYGIQYGLQRWLLSQGATYIEIEDIDFNLFTGKLYIKNLKSGDNNSPYMQIGEAGMTINWLPVFRGQFYPEDIFIKDSLLDINKRADGQLRIGMFTFSKSPVLNNKPVAFGTQNLTVMNTKIRYLSTSLKFTASIHQAAIGKLSAWNPGYATPVELDCNINGGDLRFTGHMTPFSDKLSVNGHLRLSHMPVDIFNPLLLPVTVLAKGSLEADTKINMGSSAGQLRAELTPASNPEHILDGSIILQNFSIDGADTKTSLWKSDQISIRNIRLSEPGRLSIDSIDIRSATTNLHRNAKGKWLVIQDILDHLAVKKDPQATPLAVTIGQFILDEKGIINIHDQMTSPVFQSRINIDKASITHIDSSHPEQPGEMHLAGKIDDHSSFSMSGQIQPFSKKKNLNINGEIKTLDLPPFTAYTRRHLGYILKSGHMDSNVQVKVTDDVIDGNAKLQLNNLQIAADDPDKMKTLSAQLSMPLDTAVAMLRDKNNNIQLQVPVTGNIRDPAFDFSDAINQSIGRATKTAALGYLKYTLGPFGTLIAVGQLAGELASRIRLEPVKFEAGKAELDDVDIKYLQYIAELLATRPELRIRICGTAVAADRNAFFEPDIPLTDEQLLSLAKQRASIIKQYLIKQYAVAYERLFLCNPEILPQADASPQAGLSI